MNNILSLFLFVMPVEDYLTTGNYSEATRYYELALRLNPSTVNSNYAAVCELITSRPDRAVRLLLQYSPADNMNKYYLGIAYYRLGQYDNARDCLNDVKKSISIDKKLMKLIGQNIEYYLGLINFKMQRFEIAREHLSRTSQVNDTLNPMFLVDNYEKLLSARSKINKGKYQDALAIYNNMKGFYWYRQIGLAMTCEKLGLYQRAVEAYEEIVRYENDAVLTGYAFYGIGRSYFALKDYFKAKIFLRKYLVKTSDIGADYFMGLCFSNEGKYDSAASYFQSLPDTVDEFLFYQGRTDYFRGQWGGAEEKLLRHREFFPDSRYADRAIFIIATINFKRREYDSAIEFYNDLVKIFPLSNFAADAMRGIADAYFGLKKYKEALASYKQVQNYQPNDKISSEARLMIYETRYYLKKYPSLIFALRRFVEDYADSSFVSSLLPSVWFRMAKLLNEEREYYQSLVELDKMIAKYGELKMINDALVERARVAKNSGKDGEVKRSYLDILKRKDNQDYFSYAVSELAAIYEKETKYDSALYYYNLLLSDEKSKEMAMYSITKIYDILGQYSEAETMADRLISDFPNSLFLIDVYILKSASYRRRGIYGQAIDVLNELTETVGAKPEVYIEMADLYSELQNYQKARDYYLLACDLFKQDRDQAAKALIGAGDSSRAMGDREGAREHYLRANLIAQSIALKNQASSRLMELGGE